MIVVYTAHGCASCRKVKAWLKENGINFIEKNIFKTLLDSKEIKYLLSRTENGTEDIISRRSKIIQDSKIDLDEISTDDLCDFVVENPSVLKRPIIVSEKNMQVGYDEEEIDGFKRSEIKKLARCDRNCPHYDICGAVREEA
ncbi:MAG: transcriptional regulator Spx [Erysipelotrichaceae bacterium]|nr:transcriptional regulator Spx [Erysipelotrichaceae bacterium]